MFDWIKELLVGIGDTIGSALAEAETTSSASSPAISGTFVRMPLMTQTANASFKNG